MRENANNFTQCGLIAEICRRGNRRRNRVCYDTIIKRTITKIYGGRHILRTTELFINELKERALNYKEVRTLQDGDDLVRLGFDLENTQVEMLILFDASGKAVSLRCFDVARVTKEQYSKALMSCNALNNKMRWVKFCIGEEMNIHAEADALIHEASVTEVTVQLMIRMAAIVDEVYPVINKAIWS